VIIAALRHELHGLWRSPGRLVGVVLFLGASALALGAGDRFHADWEAALDGGEALESTSIDEARGWFDAGAAGPEDRPWVNLHDPIWQDWYAGTRIGRLPSDLAGIAAGSIDDSPVVVRVHRSGDPFRSEGLEIENPELGRTEALDLVFVLGAFIPLLVGLLGLGCGARERESGIERLIAIQRGSAWGWFVSRGVATTIIVAVAVTVVWVGAAISMRPPVADAVRLLGLSWAYVLLWGGLLMLTGIAARSVKEATVLFGATWVLLVVLVPSLLSEAAVSAVADDYGIESTLDERAEQYGAVTEDVATILPDLYAAYPELAELPAAGLEELPRSAQRLARAAMQASASRTRHEEAIEADAGQARASMVRMIACPPVALTLAAETLAGRTPEAAAEFRGVVVGAVEDRIRWLLTRAWQNDPLTADDFAALVASSPPHVATAPGGVLPHVGVLLGWAAVAWTIGVVRLRRGARA